MSKIDTEKNKKQFLKNLDQVVDEIKAMDADCFNHCGYYFLLNDNENKEEGQDNVYLFYKGPGSSGGGFP